MKRLFYRVLALLLTIILLNFEYGLVKPTYAKAVSLAAIIVSSVTNSKMTQVEKLIVLHDYLIYHTNYGYSGDGFPSIDEDVLEYGNAICEGYAGAFQLLCNEAGITCEIIEGTGFGRNHAWNKVKLSDGWYNVDVTFDDPINGYTGEAGGFENRNYLLVSSKVLKKDHNWDNSIYSKKEGKKYLYYGQYVLEDGIPVAVAPDAFQLYNGFKDRLTELTLPETIKMIGDGAFYECTSLKKVIIGPNVNYIGEYAFYECKKLKEINIPQSVEEIGSFAFYNCNSLSNLEIPNTIALIGGSAFKNTPWMDSKKDKFIIIGNGVLIGTNLSDYNQVDIPGNVKVISGTFQDVDALHNVTIPDGVTHIIDSAFSNTSISSLILPDTVMVIGDNICMDCHELEKVKFPSNLKKVGQMAFYNCYNLEKAEFPDGLESIDGAAFENCHCLDDVVIPKSVTFT